MQSHQWKTGTRGDRGQKDIVMKVVGYGIRNME